MQIERPGVLRLAQRTEPAPGPHQVLVRVHTCGVCRTDMHLLDGEVAIPRTPIVPGHQIVGTVIALALRRRFRFRGVILALVILPWALPAVVEAVVWSWIYDQTFGVMNSALHSAHLIGGYHVWLGLERWLTIALIEVVQVWQITPLSAIVILAALQSVPLDLYEAARVDGAGALRMFFSITIPLLRPIILFTVIVSTITGMQSFTEPQVLFGSVASVNPDSGGPGQAGLTLILYFYHEAFDNNDFGYAAAIAWAAFLVILLFTAINLRLVARKEL